MRLNSAFSTYRTKVKLDCARKQLVCGINTALHTSVSSQKTLPAGWCSARVLFCKMALCCRTNWRRRHWLPPQVGHFWDLWWCIKTLCYIILSTCVTNEPMPRIGWYATFALTRKVTFCYTTVHTCANAWHGIFQTYYSHLYQIDCQCASVNLQHECEFAQSSDAFFDALWLLMRLVSKH